MLRQIPRSRRWLPLVLLITLSACSMPFLAEPPATAETTAPSATATVLPTSTPIALTETIEVEAAGFRLRVPNGWRSRDVAGTLTLAPDVDSLEMTTPGENLVIQIDSTPLDTIAEVYGSDATLNPAAFFDFSSDGPRQAGYTLSEAEPIAIDGSTGLSADLQAAGGAGRLVVVLTASQAMRVLGQAAPAAWENQQAVFEEIVASIEFFAPVAATTPTPTGLAVQPLISREGPENFVIRIGGVEGEPESRFTAARGLSVDDEGRLYLAERDQGVWVFEPDGTLVRTFGKDDLVDAYDVAVNNDGEIFVADYGSNAIVHFDNRGTLLNRWGSAGEAPEQFGFSSPQRIALGSDGSIYALDDRSAPDGSSTALEIVRFDPAGELIERIALPAETAPNDLAIGRRGDIYLADAVNNEVVRINSRGEILARYPEDVGDEDIDGIAAGAVDVDSRGNIYVATWNVGILRIAPDGTLVARGGETIAQGMTPQTGQFSLPNGIAVADDGLVWVSDNSGEYSALTGLRLEVDPIAEATANAAPPLVDDTAPLTATTTVENTTPVAVAGTVLRQWASAATASSAYEGYPADNASGPPDAEGCSSSQNAWAAADPNGQETLELSYSTAVLATGINVHQNHRPGFITRIDLLDLDGEATTVYRAAAILSEECPLVLAIEFEQTSFLVDRIRLTIDQRSGANWNEIDAVELVGVQ